ncbi:MAG TPA: SDR family oxidoreductase [Flavipsychrobacter sp.]|nr:SDR family oxidoreductase [Flavipsychrobacter sp.]
MPNAVITGATHGIGKATAERFLRAGFSVAVCARSKPDLDAVSTQWKEQFPDAKIETVVADLGNGAEVKHFAEHVLSAFDDVAVLVNNAGLFFPGKLAAEPEGQLEYLMQVNVYSAYQLTRALLPVMKKKRSGHIFNLCSVASLTAYENGGAYSITKYALQGFSENLRMELMEDRIKVTAVMPGATWSRSWAKSGLPEERFMKPEDVAEMIFSAYNLSPQANVETIVMRPLQGDI